MSKSLCLSLRKVGPLVVNYKILNNSPTASPTPTGKPTTLEPTSSPTQTDAFCDTFSGSEEDCEATPGCFCAANDCSKCGALGSTPSPTPKKKKKRGRTARRAAQGLKKCIRGSQCESGWCNIFSKLCLAESTQEDELKVVNSSWFSPDGTDTASLLAPDIIVVLDSKDCSPQVCTELINVTAVCADGESEDRNVCVSYDEPLPLSSDLGKGATVVVIISGGGSAGTGSAGGGATLGATIGITQSIAMGGQLSMPNVPNNFFGFAIAFAWANLNFGIVRLGISPEASELLKSIAAEPDPEDLTMSGLYRYACALGFEPRHLFLDILLSYSVCLIAIAIAVTASRASARKLIRMHEDVKEKRSKFAQFAMRKLSKERCQRVLDRASIRRACVVFTYFVSYQVFVGVFFQLRLIFGGTVMLDSADGLTSVMGAVAIILFLASAMILGYASWLYLKHSEQLVRGSNLEKMVVPTFRGMVVKDLTTSFEKKFKNEQKLFWMIETLKRIGLAMVVAVLTPHPGAQTALVLAAHVLFCVALLVLKPFKNNPVLRTTIAHAYALNSIFYVIFATGTNLSEDALISIGKCQIAVSFIAYIALFLLSFEKVAHALKLHERISWRPPSSRFVSFNSWKKDGAQTPKEKKMNTKTDSIELATIAYGAHAPTPPPPPYDPEDTPSAPIERVLSHELKAYSSSNSALANPKKKRGKKNKSPSINV